MGEASVITKEMRDAIGVEWEPFTLQIDKWLVKLFTDAVGDFNPLYVDEKAAKKTRLGGTVAPFSLLNSAVMRNEQTELPFPMPLKRMLDGGGSFEFYKPFRAGDVLTARTKLADIKEREGKAGKMAFIDIETTWTNQRQEVVAVGHAIRICY